MELTAQQRKELKAKGILSCRDGRNFAVRVLTGNGVMNAAQLGAAAAAAQKYGDGRVCFTSRLSAEIMYVPYENLTALVAELAAAGLTTGGTGAKVRPLACCKGSYCVFGLCDTQGVTSRLHERFFVGYAQTELPHKFKIAVGGCPNNCMKPDLNDVGLVAARKPQTDLSKCRGCKKCAVAANCRFSAAEVKAGKLDIDDGLCAKCGKCFEKCPFGVVPASRDGFRIFLGGRWGKVCRRGDLLPDIYSPDEAFDTVEKVILLFKELGKKGERLGAVIERVGIEEIQRRLAGDSLLQRKAEILALPVLS